MFLSFFKGRWGEGKDPGKKKEEEKREVETGISITGPCLCQGMGGGGEKGERGRIEGEFACVTFRERGGRGEG